MATAILHLSAAVGADMIAEGVETEAEASTLVDLGCSVAQGYLFAKPMPIDDLTLPLGTGLGRVSSPGFVEAPVTDLAISLRKVGLCVRRGDRSRTCDTSRLMTWRPANIL